MSPIRKSQRRRYPPNWKAISDRIRFQRAGGRCECRGECGCDHRDTLGGRPSRQCDARHGDPHPITGSKVILTVAHLDHTPENCKDSNLLAMCQKCHLAYDSEEHARVREETKNLAQRLRSLADELDGAE